MLEFTLINSELRIISNDKITLKYLIINYLRCHLSFVIFAFTLSFQYLAWFLCRIFSLRVCVFSFPQLAALMKTAIRLCPISLITGRVFKILYFLCMNLSDFVVIDRCCPPIVCLSLAIIIRIYNDSKMNHPCSTDPHSFIIRSIPYCFRIVFRFAIGGW